MPQPATPCIDENKLVLSSATFKPKIIDGRSPPLDPYPPIEAGGREYTPVFFLIEISHCRIVKF